MSGLDFQLVDVKFNEGLDTKTQRKLVLPGKWDVLENVSLAKDGTPRTRDGIANMVPFINGNGLAQHNDELLVVTSSAVSSVSVSSSPPVVVQAQGQFGFVDVAKTEIRRSLGLQDSVDCASSGPLGTGLGFTAYVWRDLTAAGVATGVSLTIIDESTRTRLVDGFSLRISAAVFSPRVIFSVDSFLIFYMDATHLYSRVVSVPALNITAEVALITDANLSGGPQFNNIDAIDFGGAGVTASAMVVYGWFDGTDTVRTIQVDNVPSIVAGPNVVFTNLTIPFATLTAVTCAAFNATHAGIYAMADQTAAGNNGVWGRTILDTWVFSSIARHIDNFAAFGPGNSHITACLDGGNMRVYYDQQAAMSSGTSAQSIRAVTVDVSEFNVAGPGQIITSATFDNTGATGPNGPQGPFICGKATAMGFVNGGSMLPCCTMENYTGLLAATRSNNQQNAFFLLDGHTGSVLAKALYGTFGIASVTGGVPMVTPPCSVFETAKISYAVSRNFFSLAVTERTLLSFADGINVSPTGICRLELQPDNITSPSNAQFGQSTYFAGGVLSSYDGAQVLEVGFNLFPEGINVKRTATGTGTLTAGVHQLCVVAEWVDGSGARHQSAPSLAVQFTATALDTLTVIVPTLLLTQKPDVTFVAYMTQAAGTTFNRIVPLTQPQSNNRAAASITMVFDAGGTVTGSIADTATIGNELLYTQPDQAGTALPNDSPGPCSALMVNQNRLWLTLDDAPNTFRYSQEFTPGVGLQFNEDLGGVLDVSSGKIIAWSPLDEKTIILCERKLYVIFGTGPTSSGGFNNYSPPQEIPSDVGCVDRHSVLKMPLGVIFKSAKGWYLLGRDLTVKYIGAGVERFNGNNVSSAVMMPDAQECRWSSLGGTTLVYSYIGDQWSTYATYPDAYGVNDALWWPVTGTYITTSGFGDGLNQETPGFKIDSPGIRAPSSIIPTYRTGWLHLAALESFQRVRWLYLSGTADAQPTSVLTIDVDYDDAYLQQAPGSYNFAINLATVAFATGVSIDLRSKLRRQKCKSVAFTFSETPAVPGDPQLTGLQALTLQLGMKRGTNKLPAAQSKG